MVNTHGREDVATHNEKSLQTLARAIALSQGRFSLILAHCNYQGLRKQALQRLREICPVTIRELVLPESAKMLYPVIQAELENEQPPALMILGLESVKALDDLLISINQVRDEFRKRFQCPLILWVTDDVLQKLVKLVPDLNSWASVPIQFRIATETLMDVLPQKADLLFQQILEAGANQFLSNSAIFGFRYRSELQSALRDLQSNGQELEPELEASRLFALGRDAYVSDQIDQALADYQKSLAFWQQSNNLERQGVLLFHLGLCYYRNADLHRLEKRQHWETAKDYFQQCINVFEQAHRPDLVAEFINQLGEVLRCQEAWKDLHSLAQKSLVLHRTYGTPVQIAQDYGFLAEVALKQAHWEEADQAAQQALEIIAQVPEDQRQHQNLYLLLLAQSQQQLGQVSEAVSNLEKARENGSQDNPQLYIAILEALRSLYYCEQQDYLRAFRVKKQLLSIQQQYGLRAFIGAAPLQPRLQAKSVLEQVDTQETAAKEKTASDRQQDINRLIERISLDEYKLIVLHGPSGVGKSSLIHAGLVPELKQRIIGIQDVLPIVLQVSANWIEEIGKSLANELRDRGIKDISLPTNPDSVEVLIEELQRNESYNLLTVLIFDEFEEFLFIGNQVERRPFYEFLRDCLNIPFVKVIISLRDDYLHYLLEAEQLPEDNQTKNAILKDILNQHNRYFLKKFSKAGARVILQAINKNSQLDLEDDLIEELVQKLAGNLEEVRPFELQLVGVQLQASRITSLKQYQQSGSLTEQYLKRAIEDCGLPNEKIAVIILYLLTSDQKNSRPRKTRSELVQGLEAAELKSEAKQLELVFEVLVHSGLIILWREAFDGRYQIVHDYLVEHIRQLAEAKYPEEIEKLRQSKGQVRHSLEITKLISESKFLLLEDNQLAALLASVKAGRKFQELEAPTDDIKAQVVNSLREALDQVQELNHLEEHSGAVYSGSCSPDGKFIASASNDRTVKLLNLDGSVYKTLGEHSDWVISVCFSQDSKLLASASTDGEIKLWNVNDGSLRQSILADNNWIFSVSFAPDSKLLASAHANGEIKLWNINDGSWKQSIKAHKGRVRSVSFSPNRDNPILASASDDHTVKLWNVNDGKLLQQLKGHSNRVYSVSFSPPDGLFLASASADHTVILWKRRSNSVKMLKWKTFSGHHDRVRCVSFSRDGKIIASASDDKTVKIWSADGELLTTLKGHKEVVRSVSFSRNNRRIASVSEDNTIKLWYLHQLFPLATLRGHTDSVHSVKFSLDNSTLVSASWDDTVRIWNRDGTPLGKSFKGHQDWVWDVSVSPDGQLIASASGDHTIKLWNRDGYCINTLKRHSDCVNSVNFSPDGQLIASASADKTVKLWNRNGSLIKTLEGHSDRVWYVDFSPNGQLIASASADKTVRLWHRDGSFIRAFTGHKDWVNSISFSQDNNTLVSASNDSTIKLWKLDDGTCNTLHGHRGKIWGVSFSPDGELIASACTDKTVRLWSKDGIWLKSLKGHIDSVTSVSFSRDGKMLASSSADKTVKLWNLDGLELPVLGLDELLTKGCDWLHDYLKTNPNVSERDRHLCSGKGCAHQAAIPCESKSFHTDLL